MGLCMTVSENSESFFVKLMMKNGRAAGHVVSSSKEFPEAEKILELNKAEHPSSLDERLSRHVASFVDSMTVYTEFMPVVLDLVPVFTGEMFKASMENFLQCNAKSVDEVEDGKIYELSTKCYSDFVSLSSNTKPSFDVMSSLTRNVLMGLVALLDQHVRDAMRISLNANPDWLDSANATMTLEEIFRFTDLKQLREKSIESEVDRLSRESRDKQIEWFEKKFKLEKVRDGYVRWPQLMEICERRNLFAHTNGYVNEQYMEKAEEYNFDVSGVNIGDKLAVTNAYYKKTVRCIFEFGVMLSHIIRKKMMKGKESKADEDISELGFNLINRGDYELAVRLLEFAYRTRDISSERVKRTLAVNYANALKLSGQRETSMKVLGEVDWSASSTDFEICVAAIRGEVEAVSGLMKKAKDFGLPESAFREWPVFFEVRESEEFKRSYEGVFGLPYSPSRKKRDAFSELIVNLPVDGKIVEGREMKNLGNVVLAEEK
jgi:hypothetical protein